ncbi:MAG: type II toxin-antitoxin system PemK/MazF family toxin [Thiomonas sp.]|uniref:type II toxin-antitoxin system PemK/MazF family toxin n=1 Tax=Thiomonas sp. TaxID=2047785 RepID=UPI002A36215A|nr:type II toxin-antitoxin system PemK/MazF family toxin [Thiomonas sp.]MDY0329818.1 type II toxin-antitoxin system PemK/MazF family toxin [Thiomonas sp.]
MTYERWQVLRVPFPFTDRTASKNRPALVLSDAAAFNTSSGHVVMAMITSAKNPSWPLDCPIENLAVAGLPAPSVVRAKFFTLDERLIRGVLGTLDTKDAIAIERNLRHVFGFF